MKNEKNAIGVENECIWGKNNKNPPSERSFEVVGNGFPSHLYAVGRDAESGYKAAPICTFKPKIVYK